jgi:hypothetical protein
MRDPTTYAKTFTILKHFGLIVVGSMVFQALDLASTEDGLDRSSILHRMKVVLVDVVLAPLEVPSV